MFEFGLGLTKVHAGRDIGGKINLVNQVTHKFGSGPLGGKTTSSWYFVNLCAEVSTGKEQ